MRMGFLSFALLATLTAACGGGQGRNSGQVRSSESATVGTSGAAVEDRRVVAADAAGQDAKDFIDHVAIVNMAEVELGNLAAQRAASDAVRTFARTMVDDHTAFATKLNSLATAVKVRPSDRLDEKHKDQQDKLSKLSGGDFDREYATAMVEGHEELIEQLEPRLEKKTLEQWKDAKATPNGAAGVAIRADAGDNPTTVRVNQFAADIYPTVYAHFESAKALENSLKKRSTQ
jgi:putative membrane protein